jgi:penicillin G amidase
LTRPPARCSTSSINDLLRRTFADELGEEAFTFYLLDTRSHALALAAALADDNNPWFDDVRTPRRETRDEIVWRSFTEASGTLAGEFGDDVNRWSWGRLHTTTFEHELGSVPLLGRFLSRGPFPRGGDTFTVNVSPYSFLAPYREAHHVSLRWITDVGNQDGALAILPTGQSGQLS